MADELNIPTHRWYQPRNNIALASSDFSKQYIFDSGIQKIDAFIGKQPWGNPVQGLFALAEPGVWYDPSDVANLDWRRNLLTYTEQFDNAAWTKTNATVTANAGTAPDGTTTAGLLTVDTATSSHSITTPLSAAGIGNHVASYYVKSNGANFVQIAFGASSKPNNAYVNFDLSTPSVGTSSFATGLISSVGNGWFRISCAVELDITSSQHSVAIIQSASNARLPSFTGDGTSGIYIWGAQLEVGSTATEYQRITDVNTEFRERFPTATLFQDTAGTTPVTTAGQTVALALDKSKGLVLGPELIGNGTFADPVTTGWTPTGGTLSVVDGWLRLTSSASSAFAGYSFTSVAGTTYVISGQWRSSAGSWRLIVGTASGGSTLYAPSIGASGSFTAYVQATGTTTWISVRSSVITVGDFVEIDNISVRELAGNHATQATAASRPTYGVVPQGGRRNLLTFTEQFDNAAWAKNSVTATADKIVETATTAAHSVSQAFSLGTVTIQVEIKSAERSFALVGNPEHAISVNLSTGVATSATGSPINITSVASTDGYWRVRFTATFAVNASLNIYTSLDGVFANRSYAGVSGSGIFARRVQLETGSTATNYQRVVSAFDVTEAGVPSLHYLSFDGVDDFLVTPTITPGTDKVQVFAGVRKLSDAAAGMLVESSASASLNAGSFYVSAPDTAGDNYRIRAGGSIRPFTALLAPYASPISNVLTGLSDIAGDSLTARINGSVVETVTSDQGTGNFLAYPLYIGRRGGTTLPFNGQLYSLVVRFGANLDANTITNTETWVNSKTGAY